MAALQGQGLITAEDTAQVLSQEHTGFSVWLGDPFNDKERELFVARYIERGPVAFDRFDKLTAGKLSVQHDIVTYITKDGTAHEYDVLEFLALLSAQVPNCGESVTRYFGRYSSRARGERRKRELAAAAPTIQQLESGGEPSCGELVESVEEKKKPSYTWADCILLRPAL